MCNSEHSHFPELFLLAYQYRLLQRVQGCCRQKALAACSSTTYNSDLNVRAIIAVDLTQGQAPLPNQDPPIPGNHDLAATLKALAANSTSFGGGSAAHSAGIDPDGIDPEMIARSGTTAKMDDIAVTACAT